MIAFGIVLLKKTAMQNDGESTFRNLRWQRVGRRFQKILSFATATKLLNQKEKKTLDDIMILVTTPQEHQIG